MQLFSTIFKSISLPLLIVILIGCNSTVNESTAPPTETAEASHVRIIHSASSASELDFTYRDLSDNNYYLLQEDGSYGYQYGYFNLYTGEREIKAFLSNSQIGVAGLTLTLENDKKYTILAYDYEATINPELLALNDTVDVPESGMSLVRFIHVGADISEIRISEIDGNDTITGLKRLENSNYIKMSSQTYHFRVISPQSQEILIEDVPVTLLSQHTYSIVLSGSVSGITGVDFNAKLYRETSL